MDNLSSVTPAAGQGRSFVYTSLKRLASATNPESGTTTYTYDANGNLATRTLGAITTTYAYDEHDELTGKSYNDNPPTPAVTYTYNRGWLTSVANSNTSVLYSGFDGLGRVLTHSQTTNGAPAYTFQYGYNLADGITSLTLPSGRVVSTGYDAQGRVKTLASTLPGQNPVNYVSGTAYAAHGALQQITLNNTLIEQACFNGRLEPAILRQRKSTAADCATASNPDTNDVLHLRYDYESSGNSTNTGNVSAQTITFGTKIFHQNYAYDGVNRLAGASETGPGAGWSENFGYDAVGNRWVSGSSGIALDPFTPISNVYDSGNHMTGSNAQYVSGNQTAIGGYQFQYDAENRLRSSTINSGTTTYAYDGNGRRVMKVSPESTTAYVYDAQGQLAAEYSSYATAPAPPPCTTCYVMADMLGSTRMLTNAAGAVVALHDYLPFGEEIVAGTDGRDAAWGGPEPKQKFTGKERDTETGLDNFFARYFSAAQGRFTSPDEPLNDQDQSDPQSWNLYNYVRNNPLRFIDPTGRECVTLDNGTTGDNGQGKMCQAVLDADKNKKPDVTVTDFEPPSPLLLAVAQGAQRASPVTDPRFIAQFYGASIIGGGVGAGVALYAGTGLTTLSIGAARAATLAPLILPAGQKLAQIIARLGQGQQNPQLVLQKLTELRDAATAAGTAVQGFYIQSGVTIYRVGQDYLTVSGQGKILSYVQNATPATGVVQRYIELGGK